MKKIITVLLSVVLIATMIPCTVFAAGVETYVTTIEEAGAQLRTAMVARSENCEINYKLPLSADFNNNTINKLASDIYTEAVKHTGNPVEGDYLHFVNSGYRISASAKGGQDAYYTKLIFSMGYYTTAQQEEELTKAVDRLKQELALDGKSDYDKLHELHDYMMNNIEYDYESKELQNNNLCHTAYNALIKKKAVCQGYATLYYRMALEYGIDCCIVTGRSHNENHAWNLVKLGNDWYNLDATWDACSHTHEFFLVGGVEFKDHVRDAQYKSPDFVKTHHMCEDSYETGIVEHKEKYIITPATTTKDGRIVTVCQKCGETLTSQVIHKASSIWLSADEVVYNGKEQSSAVVVRNSKGEILDKKYYTVIKPKGRKNVGTYTYTIRFKEYYSGSKTVKMTVLPKAPTAQKPVAANKSFTAKWKKSTKNQYDGYEVQYSTVKNFAKNKTLVKVKGTKATSKKISKLKAKKTYYVRVRTYKKVGKKLYYSGWSKTHSVKVK